jgi:hypothetical protein
MATATSIINRALRMCGAIDAIETPSAADLSNGLDALNEIIAGMSIARGLIHAQTTETLTLTGGDGNYSIGSGADFDTARPIAIESAYITVNGIDSPLCIDGRNAYNAIADKTTQGTPSTLYYDATFANGNIRFYPVPDEAYTVTISAWKEISQIAAVGDAVSLPEYLLSYLKVALAINLAHEYRQPVSSAWVEQREELARHMRNIHRQPVRAMFDMVTPQPYNIEAG